MNIAKRLEMVSIDKIIPYARNNRKHDKAQVAQIQASFREFGVLSPCLVDENYNLLCGHGRLLAAKAEGLPELNCVIVEGLTEAQKKAFMIADNKLGDNSSFNEELLALEFADLRDLGFDLEVTGFGADEIEKIFADDGGEVVDDDFALDDALKEPSIVKQGDLWLLQGKAGTHRLLCGDSTNNEDVARLMDGKKANLVLEDPPYLISYDGKAGKIKNDDLDDKKGYDFILAAMQQSSWAMADDATIYVFHADSKGEIFRRAFREADFHLSGCCIWKKNTFTLGRSLYQWQHEPCLVGWKNKGRHIWLGDRKQSTIWECDKPPKNDIHSTMKPLPLLKIPIQNSSATGNIVLDLFSGSFSTGMVSEQLGRVCYAMEIDESYLGASLKRYYDAFPNAQITCEREGKTYDYAELVKEKTAT